MFEAWEAPVLPLNYIRTGTVVFEFAIDGGQESPPHNRGMVIVKVVGANMPPYSFHAQVSCESSSNSVDGG